MRGLRYLCAVVFVALPVLAIEPTSEEVEKAYQSYRELVCASDCLPGLTDSQRVRRSYARTVLTQPAPLRYATS